MDTTIHTPNTRQTLLSWGLALICLCAPAGVPADDIEIYLQPPAQSIPPNVLFVLDESGSMTKGSPTSRRDLLVTTMKNLFNNTSLGNVNAALLGYTTRWGENDSLMLRAHSGDFKLIKDGRADFIDQIDALGNRGYTPTVKTMEAAVAWFRPDRNFTDYSGQIRPTPITGNAEEKKCVANHIVLLSDGQPNSNSTSEGQKYGLTEYETVTCASDNESVDEDGRCAREIAAWAFDADLKTDTGWDGKQNITTHTIGFHTTRSASAFLRSIAREGGGDFYPASTAATLSAAFSSIVTEAIDSIPYAYTAPVIPFSQDNAAVSGKTIYIPLFVPANETFWKGNLKPYNIATDSNGDLLITDKSGKLIFNDKYEFTGSVDLWSSTSDQGETLVGGAAAKMLGEVRKLYSNIDVATDVILSNTTNHVHRTNKLITGAMVNAGEDEDLRIELLNWISWDVDKSHQGEMGAPLHTQPVVVPYTGGHVIYLLTSEGVLEAIDSATGMELWAFMPKDLLANISTLKNNVDSQKPYYGLDGPLTVYETGRTTQTTTDDKTMAIFGMRRGGKKYYILDISTRDAPKFVAEISKSTEGFEKLGQTWSKPQFANMKIDGASVEVLVFGGGYDADQDTATSRVADDEGNAIFIIKAQDGSLLKTVTDSGGDVDIPTMTNGIAGDVHTVDMDGDAHVERLYAAGVGGRIFRVDIAAMEGGVIADINTNNSTLESDYRRFFNQPQVGYYSKGGVQFLAILLGTGDRTDPVSTSVTDRFYMIMDRHVWDKPGTYPLVDNGDLLNASSIAAVLGTADQGWYIDFSPAEKSYSKAILYDYAVMFTTYSAETVASTSACQADGTTGSAKLYAVNLVNANAAFSWNGGSEHDLKPSDRDTTLSTLGIPPTPELVFPGSKGKPVVDSEGNPVVDSEGNPVFDSEGIGTTIHLLVGIEKKREWSDRFRAIYWEEVINE